MVGADSIHTSGCCIFSRPRERCGEILEKSECRSEPEERKRKENGHNKQWSCLANGQNVDSPEGIQSATRVVGAILEQLSELWMVKKQANKNRCS